MIPIIDSAKIALKDFGKSKFRTFLTMLGMIIGVSAIIIIMSAGEGGKSLVTNQIESIGSNLIGVLPGASDEEGPPASVMGVTVTTLKRDDIQALMDEIPEIQAASGYVRSVAKASHFNQKTDISFVGVNHNYPVIESVEDRIQYGRFFNEQEAEGLNKIAILGSQVSEDLFYGENPVGKTIKVKKNNFRIIGVFEKRGTEGFLNQDTQIFIPIKTAQKILLGIDHLAYARIKIHDGYDIKLVSEKVKQVLRDQHDIEPHEDDDFSVKEQKSTLQTLDQIMGAISLFLVAIGAISLLVGGVGIMNIMLASVNQRVREIGLRKAVGAREKDIMIQFLIESMILTLLGALIGIIIGIGVSYLIALIARTMDYQWDFIITYQSVLISSIVSVLIGLFFGFYPAKKAARLNPIDALRYE